MNIYEYLSIGENEKPLDRIVTDGGFTGIFRKIGCIGDSLSSGEFESRTADGTRNFHDFYEYSWGQHIARSTGSTVYNFSRGGMTAKELGETIRNTRKAQGLTQPQLAMACGTGVRFIVDLEAGKETCQLGKALNVIQTLGLALDLRAIG